MNADKINRATGALVGLALGDALGTTLEFQPRPAKPVVTDLVGGGPFMLEPGQWTDDTSMMLCLADSLIERGENVPADQMRRYINWRDYGYNSCTGTCFDIGTTVALALKKFSAEGIALAGSTDPRSAGNGSLMRTAPVALFMHHAPLTAVFEATKLASATTHAEQRCIEACQYITGLIHMLLNSDNTPTKARLFNAFHSAQYAWIKTLHPDSLAIIQGRYHLKSRDEISSSGYVIHSLEAALWCFWHSETFEEGALLAANLGDDADSVAAIYGQLAGAYYGYHALPKSWLSRLAWHDDIVQRANLLVIRQDNTVLKRFIADCQDDIENNMPLSAEKNQLMLTGFGWNQWITHNMSLREKERISHASVAECLSLVTVYTRGDRYIEGLLHTSASDGTLDAIINRLAILIQDE